MSSVEAPATAAAGPSDGPDEEAAKPVLAAGAWGIALLSVIFAWWAWQEGAYFDSIRLIGLIGLSIGVIVLARFAPWPLDLRRSPAVVVALVALVLLGCWTAISVAWSPAPDTSLADAQRVFTYALCFACGLWFCSLLGARSELSLLPIVVAGAFAGGATLIALLTGDDPRTLLESYDGTLEYPIGYRNANAAFFAIVLFPAIGLAASRTTEWWLRGLAAGTATLCLSAFLFAQSRASLPALIVAGLVLLLISPIRVRHLTWSLIAIVPAMAAVPAAVALHGAGDSPLLQAVDELRGAGRAMALAALASAVIGMVVARVGRGAQASETVRRRGNRAVLAGMALLAVAGAALFVAREGDPVDWADERIEEFENAGTPDLTDRDTRFGVNVGSGRYDIWRVALDEFQAEPVLGTGAGGFQYAYMRDRESGTDLQDAHSFQLEILSELGIPGILLLTVGLGAVVAGAWRSRRAGLTASSLTAIALATGAYWFLHSSVDWFWAYPAITATVLALLGAACAPAMAAAGAGRRRAWRPVALVAVGVVALSAVPPLLSERYVDAAYAGWKSDIGRAYDDLDRAAALNPFSEEPLLAEGAIALAAGDRERALAAFRDAAEERPEEWAAHYYVADLSRRTDPALARREAEIALSQNPNTLEIRRLARSLGIALPPLSYQP